MAQQLVKRPRRMLAPSSFGARPVLEQIHQPLYSAVALDNAAALPRQVQFFNYAIGQNVTGAGGGVVSSTAFHTNMQTVGFLSQPKQFTCSGVRLRMASLDYALAGAAPALSDPTMTAAAPTDDDLLEDLLGLLYSGIFRFTVGPKVYTEVPAYQVPANSGIGGVTGVAIADGTAATSRTQRRSAQHGGGRYYRFPMYPVLISAQQSFSCELIFPWATNLTLNDDRYVWAVLDGILSREVQ